MSSELPIEQFIRKLTELERTMTKGHWRLTNAEERDIGFGDVCAVGAMTPNMLTEVVRDAGMNEANAHGIAHLKNSNPTVIAMLKAAIEFVETLETHPESSHTAYASEVLAHLNTLAAEVLRTQGEKL